VTNSATLNFQLVDGRDLPRLFFTELGLDVLRVMMADRRIVNQPSSPTSGRSSAWTAEPCRLSHTGSMHGGGETMVTSVINRCFDPVLIEQRHAPNPDFDCVIGTEYQASFIRIL
jgi:hypothetical protein